MLRVHSLAHTAGAALPDLIDAILHIRYGDTVVRVDLLERDAHVIRVLLVGPEVVEEDGTTGVAGAGEKGELGVRREIRRPRMARGGRTHLCMPW